MAISISGNGKDRAVFSDSSIAPPTSGGIQFDLSLKGFNCGQIWLVTSGGWTPSTTSARTVMDISRLRRQRIDSGSGTTRATWDKGTGLPLRDRIVGRRSAKIEAFEATHRHHFGLFGAVPHGGYPKAGDERLQGPGNILRGQAKGACAVLVDIEADGRHALVPVEMGVDGILVCTHNLAHVVGDAAHLHRIGADDAKLHREADRRPEIEAIHTHARLRQSAVRQCFFEPHLMRARALPVFTGDTLSPSTIFSALRAVSVVTPISAFRHLEEQFGRSKAERIAAAPAETDHRAAKTPIVARTTMTRWRTHQSMTRRSAR